MWQMRLHGWHRRPLTAIGGTDPNVSPDGRTLTWVNGTVDLANGLVAAGRYGRHLRQLVPFTADVFTKHDWAPDGRHLVYATNGENLDGPGDLVLVRPDGSHPRRLTHNPTTDDRATVGSFSPDGRWVLYRESHGTSYALWAVTPSGTHRHLVYGPVPEDARPRTVDWGPRRS
jgi:Tol biopolymer transport system component